MFSFKPPAKRARMTGYSSSSGVGSSPSFVIPATNDKFSQMRQFIAAAHEYKTTRSEAIATQLHRHLQIIGVAIDQSIFDPQNRYTVEFFVSLHELLSRLESHSILFWAAVHVLQFACRNQAAKQALIHTYDFLPILSRYLSDQLIREKKQRLLHLIQELTYGIRIRWHEPYLPGLIRTLVDWVKSGETSVVNSSLGIIVNLCYKNLHAVYILIRVVDTKTLMRTVLSLEEGGIQVHIFKLLFTLENNNVDLLTKDISKFMVTVFETIGTALKTKDLLQLRNVIDFFIDVKTEHLKREVFLEFQNYGTYVENFIGLITSSNESGDSQPDPEIVAILFDFFRALVQLNIPELVPLHANLARIALDWVQTDNVSSSALRLLLSVATTKDADIDSILKPLANGLQVLLVALNTGCSSDDETYLKSSENKERLTGLFQLLKGMIQVKSLRSNVLEGLKIEAVSKIFSPLSNSEYSPRLCGEETLSTESTDMYINAIALTQQLALLDPQWGDLYSNLMEQKQVHCIIAYALCKGDTQTKITVFELSKTAEFPADKIANASLLYHPTFPNTESSFTQNLPFPSVNFNQEQQLQNLINKLQDAFENSQPTSIATSTILELFEYKMASVQYSEQIAQSSIEEAGKQVTQAKHHISHLIAESAQLREKLIHSLQAEEETIRKLKKLEEDMRHTVTKLAKSKTQSSELENQLKASQGQLQIKMQELRINEERYQSLSGKHNEALSRITELTEQVAEMENKNSSLKNISKKMEEKICDLDKSLAEKKDGLVKASQRNAKLTEEIATYEKLCKRNEEQMKQKEKDYAEIQAELEDYKSKLNWIVQISQNKIERQPS